MTDSIVCKNCIFGQSFTKDHDSISDVKIGFCYRFPPTVIANGDGTWESHHPQVSEYNWCGEFKIEKTELAKLRK